MAFLRPWFEALVERINVYMANAWAMMAFAIRYMDEHDDVHKSGSVEY